MWNPSFLPLSVHCRSSLCYVSRMSPTSFPSRWTFTDPNFGGGTEETHRSFSLILSICKLYQWGAGQQWWYYIWAGALPEYNTCQRVQHLCVSQTIEFNILYVHFRNGCNILQFPFETAEKDKWSQRKRMRKDKEQLSFHEASLWTTFHSPQASQRASLTSVFNKGLSFRPLLDFQRHLHFWPSVHSHKVLVIRNSKYKEFEEWCV